MNALKAAILSKRTQEQDICSSSIRCTELDLNVCMDKKRPEQYEC